MRATAHLPLILASLVGLAGCFDRGHGPIVPDKPPPPGTKAAPDRDAFVPSSDPYGETATKVVYLAQNWTPEESLEFYFTAQGSQLIPYAWSLALEQPGASTTPFLDPQNFLRYRYLPQKADAWNPDGLPVGFVGETASGVKWLGMTCAACHTSELHVGDVAYRVDGAPTQADVQAMMSDMVVAVKNTVDDSAKFGRFAGKVLAGKNDAANQAELKRQMDLWLKIRSGYNRRNFPGFDPDASTPSPPHRFGRLDAVGAIVNEVYWTAVKNPDLANPTVVARPADAPVSYPFLWNAPQQDKVQWLGIGQSGGVGGVFSLSRNVGEVIGVFGHVEIPSPIPLINSGYASTVDIDGLRKLETLLESLWSPTWPDAFGPVDTAAAARGAEIFKRKLEHNQSCFDCHKSIDRTSPDRSFQMTLFPTGTDSKAFDNFNNRSGPSGKLEGQNVKFAPFTQKIPAIADASTMITNEVIGVILGRITKNPPMDQLQEVEYGRRRGPTAAAPGPPKAAYEARPLNGIWATAPFLHNGSVPTLDALFRAQADRPKSFSIGVRKFDTKKVGFADADGFPKFDATLPGNSNAGHEYGIGLSDEERGQLIEYLKTL